MALTEREVVDVVETLVESGHIQVRKATIIERDGVEISRTFHRHVVAPGDPVDNEDEVVKAIAAKVHTPEVVAAYQAKQQANESAAI